MADFDHFLRQISDEHGVFLRSEAVALGFDDGWLRRLRRNGTLHRVRHGAYVPAGVWEQAGPEERHVITARAVVRTHADVVLSHHTASVLHGFDLWNAPLEQVHLTRMDAGAGRRERDVVHHVGLTLPEDVVTLDGVRVTAPARAALETASLLDVERGLAVVDSGLRLRAYDAEQLNAQARLMESWPHSQHLRVVASLADGRSGSVGESRTRYLLWRYNLPAPTLQFEVYDERGNLVAVVDFAWPEYRLILEFDGKIKYQQHLRPGESPSDAVFREKQREDAIRAATGWTVIRVTWDMLATPGRLVEMIRARLRSAA